jgi:hypothetical protein
MEGDMTRTRLLLAALIAGSVAFYSGNALALLGFDVVSGMQAQGTVFGATPQTITDEEVTTPFARSIVSVANSGTSLIHSGMRPPPISATSSSKSSGR